MNAADVLARAQALLESEDPTAPGAQAVGRVTAVHDAVVVDICCDDHGLHALAVCPDCGTVDGAEFDPDDYDCDLVSTVIEALGLAP